jgi:hypothetical protein
MSFLRLNSKFAPLWGLQITKADDGLRLADRQTFERFIMANDPHESKVLTIKYSIIVLNQ